MSKFLSPVRTVSLLFPSSTGPRRRGPKRLKSSRNFPPPSFLLKEEGGNELFVTLMSLEPILGITEVYGPLSLSFLLKDLDPGIERGPSTLGPRIGSHD